MLQLYENAAAELEEFTEHLRTILVGELLMQNVSPAERFILQKVVGLRLRGQFQLEPRCEKQG